MLKPKDAIGCSIPDQTKGLFKYDIFHILFVIKGLLLAAKPGEGRGV